MALDVLLTDQAGQPWSLRDQLDAAALLIFLRGDWWSYCNGQLVSLARLHPQFLEAGTRLFAISIDSPRQNSAMIEKLSLPFPYLSDPDRSQAITPFGVADEEDERNISRPALVVLTTEAKEAFRFESRDFADRMPEEDVLAAAQALSFPTTTQEPPEIGPAEAGPRTLNLRELKVYFRGARFAAQAMGLRHAHYADEIKVDSKTYVAEMDRYTAAIEWLERPNSK